MEVPLLPRQLPTPAARDVAAVCFAVVIFATALPNGWLGDDHALLVNRLSGITGSSLPTLLGETYWGPLHASGGLYRPAALMLLGGQRLLFGLDLPSYRLVTICLHATASVLVLRLLKMSHASGALAGALLFALHPIHAEAVTTVYGQQDVAAGVLALMALHAYLAARSAMTIVMLALTAGLYFLSMLCKEIVVLLPVLFWVWQRPARGPLPNQSWWVRPAPWIGLAFLLYAALRVYALGPSIIPLGDATVAAGYPWWARGTLMATTLGTYLRLLVLPWGQTTYYGHLRSSIFGVPVLELAVVGLATAGLLVAWHRTRDETIRRAGAVLIVFLLPVVNIVPIGTVVAERCLYLPVLAVSLLAATTWRRYIDAYPRAVAAITTVVLLLCGVSAARVALRWRTPLSHWRATVADHPGSPKAHATVALLVLEELVAAPQRTDRTARLQEADVALTRALALHPESPDAWRGRTVLHILRGECEQAAAALTHVRTASPDRDEVVRLLESGCP